MVTFLRFGDSVMLHCIENNQTMFDGESLDTKQTSQGYQGFLTGLGFTDEGVYVQLERQDNLRMIHQPSEIIDKIPTSRNSRHYMFQLTPRLNYEAHEDLEKNMRYYKELRMNNFFAKKDFEKYRKMKLALEKKLQKLQVMVRLEKAKNEKLIEDTINSPVTFGSEIQLMHADSKSYICGSRTCTQNIKVGYECKLSQWFSKMMIFKILPKLKSRNEGEMIQYKDLVLFENTENFSYLSFCFSKPVKYLQCNPSWTTQNPLRQVFNATNNDVHSYHCYLSMIPHTSFTCVLHCPNRRKDKTLYGQQFIRIAHTEIGGYLGADIVYPSKSDTQSTSVQPQVYLRVDNSEHAPENQSGSTVWEFEMLKLSESGHAILLKDNPPFKEKLEDEEDEYDIEALDDSKYSVPIMIKHVCSSLRIESKSKVKDTMTDLDVDRGLPLLEDFNDLSLNKESILEERSKFHFHLFPLVKLNKFAQVDQTYFIADSYFKFLKYSKSNVFKRADIINGRKFEKSKYKQHIEPLEDKDINSIRYRTYFSNGISSKDTFLISRLKQHEVEDIMFVKSAVYHLNYLSEFFIRPQSSESRRLPSDKEYLMVYKVLNKVTQFVVEQETLTGRDSYEIDEGKPNQSRQHLIKDMGVIDLIMDIILFSMKNEFYNVEEINSSSPFTPVLRASYFTLRKSIEEYRPNELYASQWLTVIIHQSLNFSGANGIEADKTLKELIDNNRTILMNRITDTVVQTCISSLKGKTERDDKYIGILRALCICNGTAIIQNQKLLTSEIVEKDSKDPSKALLIPFKMNEENDIEIYVSGAGEGRWEDLETFVSNINKRTSGFYPYLISMITLLSDICFGRNYKGIEVLQEIYPINLCLTILMDETCPLQMREVFGKLMSNLWINVSPFYKIQLPNPIKTYEGLSDKLTFTHFSGKRIIYDKVKEYIPRYIKNFTEKLAIEDPMEVRLVITLMEIMLLMIELGMYNDVRELNDIIASVKMLLKKRFLLEYKDQDRAGKLGFYKYFKTQRSEYISKQKPHEIDPELESTVTTQAATDSTDEHIDTSKWLGCKILNAILEVQNDCRVNSILFEFSNLSHICFTERNKILDNSKKPTSITNVILGKDDIEDQKLLELKKGLMSQFYQSYTNGCKSSFFINLKNDQEMTNILLALTLSSDFRLKTQSLQLFYELHSQINMTKINIDDSILLDSTNTKMSYLDSLNLSRALKRLAETTEKWYTNSDSAEFEALEIILAKIEEHLLQPQSKAAKAVYTEPISIDDDEDNEEGNQIEGPEELSDLEQYFCKEIKYVVNPFYQNIFRHLEIIESLIDLIKTDFNLLQPEKKNDLCMGPAYRTLMSKIYFILAYSCIDNQDNKSRVKEMMDTIFIEHMQKDLYNYGMYCFLYEYITDNNQMLKADELGLFINPILKLLNDKTLKDNRKMVLMVSLSQLARYQGIINQSNQCYLMQKVMPTINKNPIIDFANSKSLEIMAARLSEPQQIKVFGKAEIIVMEQTLAYYCCFLKYIRRGGEGRNNQTEYEAQIMLPLKSILCLLEVDHKNLAFTDTLLTFFWKIHVASSKRLPAQQEEIVLKILKILASNLKEYVNESENQQIYDTYILIGTCMERYESFLLKHYGRLIECCYSLMISLKCLKSIDKGSSEETLIENLIEGVFKYYQMATDEKFRVICLHFMIHLMQKTKPEIAEDAKYANMEDFKDLKRSVMSKGLRDIKPNTVKLTTKMIKHSFTIKQNNTQSSKSMTMTTMKHRTRLLEATGGQIPMEAALVEYLRTCKSQFFLSKEFENLADKEFQGLVEAINTLDSEHKGRSKGKSHRSKKTVSQFFRSMIQFLYWESQTIQEKFILIIVQIFINFLKGNNSERDVEPGIDLDAGDKDHWKSQKLFNYRQSILVELDIVRLICKLLSINKSMMVNKQAIKLGTFVLEGGNTKAQQQFFKYLKEDKTNELFRELHDIIDGSFETIENYMQSKIDIRVYSILHEGEVKYSSGSFKGKKQIEDQKTKEKENDVEESVTNIRESIKIIKQALRFLQLLCEGHYLDMQNYLREQNQYESVNLRRDFVSTGARMLGSFIKINNKLSVDLGIQIIEFLVELIQGPCVENQQKLENCKVSEYCKDLLNDISMKKRFQSLWELDIKNSDSVSKLVSKSITLLGALLEGNHGKTYREQIAENVDFDFLVQLLVSELENFIIRKIKKPRKPSQTLDGDELVNIDEFIQNYKSKAKKDYLDEKLLESFQTFFFIQTICSGSKIQKILKGLPKREQLGYRFYGENSGCIEVVFNGYIQKYYFPIHPACSHLSSVMKEKFISTYNRESPNEKMIQFMRAIPKFIDYMDYSIARKTSRIPITYKTFGRVRDMLLVVGGIINGVFFIFGEHKIRLTESSLELNIHYNDEFILVSGILHLCLTILTFFTWMYVSGPIVQMDAWRAKLIDIKSAIYSHLDNSEEKEICKIILKKNVVDQTFTEKQKLLKYYNSACEGNKGTDMLSHLDLLFFTTFNIVKNQDCRYFLFLILLSTLAYAYSMPFLYTLFMFDVIDKFDTLKNVIKAFSYHKSQLISTLVLEAILIYIYSSFAYYYVGETFYNYGVDPKGENLCVGMWHCFTTIFSLGPRTDRGIGNIMLNTSYDPNSRGLYIVRFVYDFTFFLAVNLIFLNMLSGLIIDAFAELRDQKTITEEKKRNICYVCSISRNRLEKDAEGFEIHTKKSHFLWDYLYFIYHMKMKSKTDYNGVEGFVSAMIEIEDISWLPIERSLTIEAKKGVISDTFRAVSNLEKSLAELQMITKMK